jgi:hypothetical protein
VCQFSTCYVSESITKLIPLAGQLELVANTSTYTSRCNGSQRMASIYKCLTIRSRSILSNLLIIHAELSSYAYSGSLYTEKLAAARSVAMSLSLGPRPLFTTSHCLSSFSFNMFYPVHTDEVVIVLSLSCDDVSHSCELFACWSMADSPSLALPAFLTLSFSLPNRHGMA